MTTRDLLEHYHRGELTGTPVATPTLAEAISHIRLLIDCFYDDPLSGRFVSDQRVDAARDFIDRAKAAA
jgi:hypothetical protein